jgi:hypothetical protein
MWTLAQQMTLQALKDKAHKLNREDDQCHAFTGVALNESAFYFDTHITWHGLPGGENVRLTLSARPGAATGRDVFVIMHDGVEEEGVQYDSFGEAVEAVDTEIAATAERIGVTL